MSLPPRFEHQERWLEKTWNVPGHAVFWDPGTGKSRFALDTASKLFDNRRIDAMLVLSPNGVHRQWVKDQIPLFLSNATGFLYETAKAKTMRHKTYMAKAMEAKFPIVAMSFDGIMTEQGARWVKKFLTKRTVLYVLDESTAIQTINAKRTKRIIASGVYAPYKRVMTGTPGENPFKYYPQIKFIDPGFWPRHGFESWDVFKDFFAVWIKATTRVNVKGISVIREYPTIALDAHGRKKYRNLTELKKLLTICSSRVKKSEAFDLPPKLYTKRYFDPTSEQLRVYKELADEDLTFLRSGELITASVAITKLLRYQQILSNYIPYEYDTTGSPIRYIDKKNPRLDCLMEAVEEIPHQGIIWAKFSHDIDLIIDRLSPTHTCVRFDGKVSEATRGVNRNRFMVGDAQWLVGNPEAGGVGLNLDVAQSVIYYNNSFKLQTRIQSEDRPHRATTKHAINYTDIVADGTVDVHILRSLLSGMDVFSTITGDDLKEWISL
jgi:hypothetical protein